jgi:hypothetical protein
MEVVEGMGMGMHAERSISISGRAPKHLNFTSCLVAHDFVSTQLRGLHIFATRPFMGLDTKWPP